jgi:hypothetical protein
VKPANLWRIVTGSLLLLLCYELFSATYVLLEERLVKGGNALLDIYPFVVWYGIHVGEISDLFLRFTEL